MSLDRDDLWEFVERLDQKLNEVLARLSALEKREASISERLRTVDRRTIGSTVLGGRRNIARSSGGGEGEKT